jgi:AcrR family transcriptional regulator
MAEERIPEILDAYTRYGLEGTTLQRVADEAGMARGHIRHYVGNREQLRRLFGRRMVARYADRAASIGTEEASGHRAEALVRYVFRDGLEPNDEYAAIDALMAASRYDDQLRERMCAVYAGMQSLVSDALAYDHPKRSRAVTNRRPTRTSRSRTGIGRCSSSAFPWRVPHPLASWLSRSSSRFPPAERHRRASGANCQRPAGVVRIVSHVCQ